MRVEVKWGLTAFTIGLILGSGIIYTALGSSKGPVCGYIGLSGGEVHAGQGYWLLVVNGTSARVVTFEVYQVELSLRGPDEVGRVVADCRTPGDGRWHFRA